MTRTRGVRASLLLASLLSLTACPTKHPPPSLKAGLWTHSGSASDDLDCSTVSEAEPNRDVAFPNLAASGACETHVLTGRVSDDVDVFRADGAACDKNSFPSATLTTSDNDVRLCVFVVCSSGKTGLSSECTGDLSEAMQRPEVQHLPEGMRGCCRVGSGAVTTPANCDAQYSRIPTKKPNWQAYFVIDRLRGRDCTSYEVDYHF